MDNDQMTDDGHFETYEEYKAWKDRLAEEMKARPMNPEMSKRRVEYLQRYMQEQEAAGK